MLTQDTQFQRRLYTVPDWPRVHTWPSTAGLRHLIFYARSNGFEKVLRRVGRRVLIDEAEFFQWLDDRQGKENPVKKSTQSIDNRKNDSRVKSR